MSDPLHPDDDLPPDDTLASEQALGVLEGEERAAAERRALSDPAYTALVDSWSLRLAKIAEEAPAHPAPASLWPRIERRLGETANVVELSLRRSLNVWRGATAGVGALAAGLVVALLWPRAAVTPSAPPTAQIAAVQPAGLLQAASLSSTKGGLVAFIAVLDPDKGELMLMPADVKMARGRSPELWVIPAGGKPISLGVAAFGKPVRLKLKGGVGGDLAKTLAVTLEPEGGSPTGDPTGPVVASGKLQAL